MKGVAPPSKREFQENIDKRLFIPKGGRPKPSVKRFNRVGTGAKVNSLVEADEEDDSEPKIAAFGHKHGQTVNEAARKGRKGKNNGTGTASASNSSASSSSSSSANLTPAVTPTTANSLGLAIECVEHTMRLVAEAEHLAF